ncbi:hypothetical protein RRG08_037693 [Elysia crispata]|uniref:Uncharacterized protein n=1 Tax=Elysia crispata TaxID=231223 RepID=A0AAE1A7I6_9GAST|nr:hypothetical protein RRG08_037693 [Elysia crispata]
MRPAASSLASRSAVAGFNVKVRLPSADRLEGAEPAHKRLIGLSLACAFASTALQSFSVSVRSPSFSLPSFIVDLVEAFETSSSSSTVNKTSGLLINFKKSTVVDQDYRIESNLTQSFIDLVCVCS